MIANNYHYYNGSPWMNKNINEYLASNVYHLNLRFFINKHNIFFVLSSLVEFQ
ncbi:hypothetical protein DOK79_002274 [Enterococcus sp. DIV1094]|uniref:Uncharacterized protein n=1 Tax=Candidatus Enterococcus mangumiae TaxID=2230878 RepID=A0ABZ2T1W3_9ENTE